MANKRSNYIKVRDEFIARRYITLLKDGFTCMDAYYILAGEWDLSVNHIRKIIAKSANHG